MTKPKKTDKGKLDYSRPEQICDNSSCRHGRKQHSRNGCIHCSCTKTYDDFRPR